MVDDAVDDRKEESVGCICCYCRYSVMVDCNVAPYNAAVTAFIAEGGEGRL